MPKQTQQMSQWMGEFGKNYTQRNNLTFEEFEKLYEHRFGLTRTAMNERFLQSLDRSIRILEVGSNIGNQLLCLQKMGFTGLWGIEIQENAVKEARKRTKGIEFVQASAFDIPFGKEHFDLVFTSGVLIHLSPKDLEIALKEIHRCASHWVWGFEYWDKTYKEIPYRGKSDLLWKGPLRKCIWTGFRI